MFLTPEQTIAYDRDGFVLVPELFNEREVAAMIKDIETGDKVAGYAGGRIDASGRAAKIALWSTLTDDIWTAASTCPRIVNNMRILLREEIAFFHGKVMLKEAHAGGAWEWHQDYGYWYDQGFVYPRMASAFVALDAATRENGCLQVLKGSHLMGRLEHGKVGDQTGAKTDRISQVEKYFERVHCEMTPGSVLFFHCNLLHTSAPNESDKHRRSFIMCYNAFANPLISNIIPPELTRPCPVGNDEAILRFA